MLKEKVLKTIKTYNLIEENDKIVIGVSGGPDSICLLHVLYSLKEKIGFDIVVAHVNHMLREVADMETEYVQKFCKNLKIECFVKKADISDLAKTQKKGTEEVGREVRYSFFDEVAKKTGANKIATAHNSNDRAETVILNILRGSGLSGLKGIEAIRDKKYIRPLINIERQEIEKYCIENNLDPKYDESNKENIYTRNKVRNELIPFIEKEFNPNIITSLNRMSQLVSKEDEYLEKQVEKAYKEVLIEEYLGNKQLEGSNAIILDLKKFNCKETVIKNRLVRYTINILMGSKQNIEKIHITDIVKLCTNNIGNKFLTPNKNIKVKVGKGKIFFIKL